MVLLMYCALLFSCKKGENDFSSEDLTIYLPAGSLSYNSGAASFVVARSNTFAGTGTAFPVLLTRAFDRDVEVTATIDTALLADYDRTNNSTSDRFPTDAFQLTNNGQVRIPAGQERSMDSLRIALGPQASSLDLTRQYVLPIRLSSTDSNLPLSSNRSVMYVRVTFNRITTQLNGVSTNRVVPIRIDRMPNGDIVHGDLNLTAAVNTAFAEPLTVGLRDRQEWLASYNQANQTNYVAFPAGTFAVSPASVSIGRGALSAATPFSLALSNTHAFETGRSYLLPVGITDEGPVPPHEMRGTAYFSVEVALQNIDPANSLPSGSRVDRTDWTATASSTDNEFASLGVPASVFDNNPATGWHSELVFGTPPTVTFTVDMQDQKNIRGFIFTPRYWDYFGTGYISAVTGMRVASSSDGINWTIQGSYTGSMPAGTATSPETRNVRFFTPVQARYFRFTLTEYGEYAAGFGELDAFE